VLVAEQKDCNWYLEDIVNDWASYSGVSEVRLVIMTCTLSPISVHSLSCSSRGWMLEEGVLHGERVKPKLTERTGNAANAQLYVYSVYLGEIAVCHVGLLLADHEGMGLAGTTQH